MTKKAYLLSLGCPKNLVDTEIMAASLEEAGFTLTDDPGKAAVILINTCAFILSAREESIEEILRMSQYKKPGMGICDTLAVAGCLSQRFGRDLLTALPEVDLFLGIGAAPFVGGYVKSFQTGECRRLRVPGGKRKPRFLMNASMKRRLLTPPHFAYLKIADGCSNHCSYCTIPTIRGEARSRRPEDILREARDLAAGGVKELIVVAQDITAYGMDLKGTPTLIDLLTKVAAIPGLIWIRLLYLHPARISHGLLELMAREEKICPYIDMPIQHIDDTILKRMNRRGGQREIEAAIRDARVVVPHVALRTSVILGFPGETERRFEKLVSFVKDKRFDHLGAFTYSREDGTPAAQLSSRISEREKIRRLNRIMEEQAAISYEINRGLVGTLQEVLIEGASDVPGYPYIGRCRRQAPEIDGVTYVRGRGLATGDFFMCRIVDAGEYDLFAEVNP